jgi:biopolymer transport protein ExbB/TolQ
MVLTAYFAISPVIGLFVTVISGLMALSAPGRADMPPLT